MDPPRSEAEIARLRAKRELRIAQLACHAARKAYWEADLAVVEERIRRAEGAPDAAEASGEAPRLGSIGGYRAEWKNAAGRLTPEGERAAFRAFAGGMTQAQLSKLFSITPKAAGDVRRRWLRFAGDAEKAELPSG